LPNIFCSPRASRQLVQRGQGRFSISCPPSLLKKPCVVARMEERGPPAEWAGQDSPGTNPFDSARKGAKKGKRRKGARSHARSRERPLSDSAKRPALPSGPGKALRSATGGGNFAWQKRQRFFHGLELPFCRFSEVGGILALCLWGRIGGALGQSCARRFAPPSAGLSVPRLLLAKPYEFITKIQK